MRQIPPLFADVDRTFRWEAGAFVVRFVSKQISRELHLSLETYLSKSLTLKCNEHTFAASVMRKNLPTSLRLACVHHFFIPSSSGNLKNPIRSPFGPIRPLCVHTGAQHRRHLCYMMPLKSRFRELGSGLNRASAIYE